MTHRANGTFWKPSPLFIEELASFLKNKIVLEVFSGYGYLAKCLQD